jgi:fructosamine-3-kinase
MLAAVHRQNAPRFGWARDNYIGLSPQQNSWCGDWAEFWCEKRLRPQLDWAKSKGFALEMPHLKLLEGHQPQASLLHGDLWSGNAGFTANGPVVFDPAVYYGDRETDLAMSELFGGFPREFYQGYRGVCASARIRAAQAPLQPVSPAQPPQHLRWRLPFAGESDAKPSGWSALAASAVRPIRTSHA